MRSSQRVTATLTSLLRGGGSLMRLSVIATCLSLCLIGLSAADDAHASLHRETNIPAGGPVGSSVLPADSGGASPQLQENGSGGGNQTAQEGEKSSSNSFRLAQV